MGIKRFNLASKKKMTSHNQSGYPLFVLGMGAFVGGTVCHIYVHACNDEPQKSLAYSHEMYIRKHNDWAYRSTVFTLRGMLIGTVAAAALVGWSSQ